jgi:hypothetical protein
VQEALQALEVHITLAKQQCDHYAGELRRTGTEPAEGRAADEEMDQLMRERDEAYGLVDSYDDSLRGCEIQLSKAKEILETNEFPASVMDLKRIVQGMLQEVGDQRGGVAGVGLQQA